MSLLQREIFLYRQENLKRESNLRRVLFATVDRNSLERRKKKNLEEDIQLLRNFEINSPPPPFCLAKRERYFPHGAGKQRRFSHSR